MRIFLILAYLFAIPAATASHASQIVRIAPLTVSIKSTETSIAGTAEAVPNTALVGRENIIIYNSNHATETIWCGDSNVTSSSGIPLDGTTPAISLDVDDSVVSYCISDGSAVSVRTLESR